MNTFIKDGYWDLEGWLYACRKQENILDIPRYPELIKKIDLKFYNIDVYSRKNYIFYIKKDLFRTNSIFRNLKTIYYTIYYLIKYKLIIINKNGDIIGAIKGKKYLDYDYNGTLEYLGISEFSEVRRLKIKKLCIY